MGEFQVRPFEAEEYSRWDEFVSQSPQGTLFHTAPWLTASGDPFRIYGCCKGDELRGGLVIGIRGKERAGHPCLTPYLGLVFRPSSGKEVTKFRAPDMGLVCA